jgi:EmrB/QacA subfamily drug resistance transporter
MKQPATLSELQARYGERYRWLLLLAVMIGTMASIMSSTIVNVAIPDMSHHFGLGQERAHWVSSGFMVASTVSMLTTPWLLASLGYRQTYVISTLMLLAGGIGGGLANHFGLVLAARVVEGLAAGIVQPIPAIIIIRAFQPHERGRAGGIFGMGVVLAPAIGPSIGGLLVEWFGWRSIFFMVAPFCLASLWLAYRYVPVTAPGGAAPDRRSSRLDWQGLLLCTVGTLCLLNGLVQLHGNAHALALSLLGLALLCLLGFVWWQRRQARHAGTPLMHMDLFRHRPFAMGSLVALIYGTALFGSTYLLPLYIQMGQGLSAALVGTIMLPAGIVLAVTIPLAGRLSDRVPIHMMVSLGILLLAASFALMPTLGLQASLGLLVAWTILGRIGLGFILPSLNNGAMQGLEHRLISQASSTINFLRMLGGGAGISLCGIILQWRLAAHGAEAASTQSNAARLAAFNETFVLLALVCALATLAAWQLRPSAARSRE